MGVEGDKRIYQWDLETGDVMQVGGGMKGGREATGQGAFGGFGGQPVGWC